jgi:hypothetical protein
MPQCIRTLIGIVGVGLAFVPVAWGQAPETAPDTTDPWHDDAWTHIVEREGVRIAYIYYPDADNEHDGIVVRLTNDNDVPVRYAFTLIFRAPDAETTATVRGRLDAGQMKTGDKAGLYWTPFTGTDRSIGEIGLRGLEIWPAREPRSNGSGPT